MDLYFPEGLNNSGNSFKAVGTKILFDHYVKVRTRYIRMFGEHDARFTFKFNKKHPA